MNHLPVKFKNNFFLIETIVKINPKLKIKKNNIIFIFLIFLKESL